MFFIELLKTCPKTIRLFTSFFLTVKRAADEVLAEAKKPRIEVMEFDFRGLFVTEIGIM